MTRISLLRKTADWEAVRPEWATFEHIFYNSNREVRKVKGTISIVKSVCMCGQHTRTKETCNVRWDGFGRCFDVFFNVRKKQYDIHFK